jgi:hypothetical protein
VTYAQAANLETCAGPRCHQPVDVYIPHDTGQGGVNIGYCLACAIHAPSTIPAAEPPAVGPEPQQRRRRRLR